MQQASTIVLAGAQVAKSYNLNGVQTPAAPLPEVFLLTQFEWFGTGFEQWVNATEVPLRVAGSSFAYRQTAGGAESTVGGRATWAVFMDENPVLTFSSGLLKSPGLPAIVVPPGAVFRVDVLELPQGTFAQLGFIAFERVAQAGFIAF